MSTTRSIIGKETIIFADLTQPQCINTYGVAPCAAALSATNPSKCMNCRATCQDPTHYNGSGSITTRFSMQNDGLHDYGKILPLIEAAPSVTAAVVNLGGMDENTGPMGSREKIQLKLKDGLHSDLAYDKYRLERYTGAAQFGGIGYDPYMRGTHWGKWLARNPYYVSYPSYSLTIRRGYIGDAITTFDSRTFVIDKIDMNADGSVSLTAKDLFTKLDDDKAVAPVASLGSLTNDLAIGGGSSTLSPAGIGATYPASGLVRIGDEVLAFTRSVDTMTWTRAQLNTLADSHTHGDTVQLVLAYVGATAAAIQYDLIANYTDIPASAMDLSQWLTDSTNAGLINLFTGYVTAPTPVRDLLGDLSVAAGYTSYPDPATGMVRFVPLQGIASPFRVTDSEDIIDGTLSILREDRKRVSQVWVYYGKKNPTRDNEDDNNYFTRYVSFDIAAEDSTQYSTSAVRKVFSRWIPQFGGTIAQKCGDRVISMFRDPPITATFAVHKSRALSLEPTRPISLVTDLIQDATGATVTGSHAIISMERRENDINCVSQEFNLLPIDPLAARAISLGSNARNVNLYDVYTQLYPAPVGTETIVFTVEANVIIGSNSVGVPALRTGVFPVGTSVKIIVAASGLVEGRGGSGGSGGGVGIDGGAGSAGGDAMLIECTVTIDNLGGIWGGGGGAGGGGVTVHESAYYGGGSGGGGAGDAGGDPGGFQVTSYYGTQGASGTSTAGGAGGAGNWNAGTGGTGGAPGVGGAPGNISSGGGGLDTAGNGGAGGAAGKYVSGNSFVTWLTTGDRRGNVS